MKAKSFVYVLMVITVLVFQSCVAPQCLVKLQPSSENTKWLYGQEFARDSTLGIIYEVGYDQIVDSSYLFDLDITNRSNLDILVDPSDFYYIPLNENMQPIAAGYYHALDPEEVILNIEKQLAETRTRRKNNFALSLLGLGVDMATSIAVETDHNPHNDFIRTDMFGVVQATNVANEFRAADLRELHDSWSSSTIRKTNLQPGYSMKGKVFFPFFQEASYLQMMFPVDDQCVKIVFRQRYVPVGQ